MKEVFADELWKIDRRFSRFEAWLYLLEMASPRKRKETVGKNTFNLEKDELVADIAKFAVSWGWMQDSVRNLLNDWAKSGRIKVRKEGDVRIIRATLKWKGEEKKEPKRKTVEFDFSFVSDELNAPFMEYVRYRRDVKKKDFWKTQNGVEQAYKSLVELSGSDSSVAMEIVKQTIHAEWTGLYPLKKSKTTDFKRDDRGMDYSKGW